METETIDKLFLELSQITKAETAKELRLKLILSDVLLSWKSEANAGDGIHEDNLATYNRAMKIINPDFKPN